MPGLFPNEIWREILAHLRFKQLTAVERACSIFKYLSRTFVDFQKTQNVSSFYPNSTRTSYYITYMENNNLYEITVTDAKVTYKRVHYNYIKPKEVDYFFVFLFVDSPSG